MGPQAYPLLHEPSLRLALYASNGTRVYEGPLEGAGLLHDREAGQCAGMADDGKAGNCPEGDSMPMGDEDTVYSGGLDVRARFVRVESAGSAALALREVKVFGGTHDCWDCEKMCVRGSCSAGGRSAPCTPRPAGSPRDPAAPSRMLWRWEDRRGADRAAQCRESEDAALCRQVCVRSGLDWSGLLHPPPLRRLLFSTALAPRPRVAPICLRT